MTYILVVFFMINRQPTVDLRFPPLIMQDEQTCKKAAVESKKLFSGNPPFFLGCYELIPEGEPT